MRSIILLPVFLLVYLGKRREVDFNQFKQLPILMFNMSRWDGPISSASLSLAKIMGRTNQVYYFDYPYTYKDIKAERHLPSVQWRLPALLKGSLLIKKIEPGPPHLWGVTPKATLPINWLPKGLMYRAANHYNNKILARSIQKLLDAKHIKDYILFNSFIPSYLQNPKAIGLHPTLFVYHSRDNIRVLDAYTSKHGAYLELDVVKNADLAMATALHLCSLLEQETGKKVAYLPNAGDIQLFDKANLNETQIPEDLAAIPEPRIGYTGNLCQRIDYDILWHLVRNHPDKHFVCIGPRNDAGEHNYPLDELPNLHFLGPRNITQLPAYLKGFAATIIPFKCNELTKGIYPLKINEYLAAGRTVVATPFSGDILQFNDVIEIAAGPEAFSAALQKVVNERDDLQKLEVRLARASENSWEARTELFWNLAWEAYQKQHITK